MTTLHHRVPASVRNTGRRVALAAGHLSAGLRTPPTFVVVGAQRCGTTSLFRALLSHPNILRPVMHKGVNYFDVNWEKPWNWYLSHFPLAAHARRKAAPGRAGAAVFEASGYYMFHPHAPKRMSAALPEVKIVAMVRDPVERAYSAYKHEFARGFETETFARAIALEETRITPEHRRMVSDPHYQSATYRHQAYRARGHYAEQLRVFVDLLGRDRVHVIESERFFAEPTRVYCDLLRFLGEPVIAPATFGVFNARPGRSLAPALEAELRAHFAPHDQALAELLGRRPAWMA
jgi:sulfotransferase family protein